ncbi:5'-nucleotidase [Raineyella antarctica]|uniref:5'-nucleotidase n=1 Tax=Raineyella antarctica TaxID=1577474 RepID=A0A1G6HDJ9_9ACTN|nr:bifunctional UDP-sugar hydrolase/5'-nucleotidase [Raineyella antarctica]SDB92340.1 5'-nucleotidase [Raineyella antarctica]
MRKPAWKRAATGVAALALGAGAFTAVPAAAAETNLTVLTFTDFHGRITNLDFFATLDAERTKAGADNTAVLSVGDNVGATLFESSILDDDPTIDMLNAIGVDASSVGNHEFDKGWADLRDDIAPSSQYPHTSANITGTEAALKPYVLMEKNGVKVAYIGATTADLPSLVSPAGLTGLTVTDPVAAVNKVADQLTDGNTTNGEADVIIAGYHEGHSDAITTGTSPKVDLVLNGHSHEVYAQTIGGTRAVVQAGSYGANLGRIDLGYDQATDTVTVKSAKVLDPKNGFTTATGYTSPAFAAAKSISEKAVEQSAIEGAAVVANATGDFSRGGIGVDSDPVTPGIQGKEDRGDESTMSNLVADMFADYLSDVTGKNVIGVQNPGGTRADLLAGEVTYKEAAGILPFANTLKTTDITGAQFKTMLEQQWQRDAAGATPSRPFLALSLSDNVSWTFDESRPEGDRVTSVTIDGKPLDPAATYTVGSGNFLIEGGDNFRVLTQGRNTTDTGWTDLDAWTAWLKQQKTITPSYAKRGVSVTGSTALVQQQASTLRVGVNPAKAVANGSLDMTSLGSPANQTLTATIDGVKVGTATVVDGVASIDITVSPSVKQGDRYLVLRAQDSGTTVTVPVEVSPRGGHDNGNGKSQGLAKGKTA